MKLFTRSTRPLLIALASGACLSGHAVAAESLSRLFENVSQCGEGGIEEARQSARDHANSTGENLGHHSSGLEEREFIGVFTPPALPEGLQDHCVYGLAIFSDDGCELAIDGQTVHQRYRKGQALPRLGESFHELPVLLQPGRPVEIRLKYSNVHFITRGNYADIDGVTLYLFKVELGIVPDYNRDGRINEEDKGKVTDENPWHWWVNDDKDQGDYQEIGEIDTTGHSDGNFSDGSINGIRDLTDFYPLWLDIEKVIKAYPSDRYEYVLRNADGAFNFALAPDLYPDSNPEVNGAGSFWRSIDQARICRNLPVTRIGDTGVKLPRSFIQGLSRGQGIILMECAKPGKATLILEVQRGGSKVLATSFCQQASDVAEMYRHVTLYQATGNTTNQLHATGRPRNYPDELTNNKAFVMFHGYSSRGNNEEHNRVQRTFNSEIFRRLHQSGSRAKYVAAYWDSATKLDYHKSVFQAFQASSIVKDELAFLGGNEIIAAAHSLGNVVVSNAICHEGFRPKHYYMINAASPIEAYNPTQGSGAKGADMRWAMTEEQWKPYRADYHSPNWHALFPREDHRSKLKWKGRFEKLASLTQAFNFYSTGEDVVANPVEDNVNLIRQAWEGFVQNQGLGRNAWTNQEFLKGGTSMAGFAFERNHGGWQHISPRGSSPSHRFLGYMNAGTAPGQYRTYTAEQYNEMRAKGEITNEHLAQFGLFKRFESLKSNEEIVDPIKIDGQPVDFEMLYAPISNSRRVWNDDEFRGTNPWTNPYTQEQGSALAGQDEVQWAILATAMPSVSFAAAANPVRNLNGANMMGMKSSWPKLDRDVKFRNDWQHGDFYIIGPSYVKKMYDEMIDKGELNES